MEGTMQKFNNSLKLLQREEKFIFIDYFFDVLKLLSQAIDAQCLDFKKFKISLSRSVTKFAFAQVSKRMVALRGL